MLKWKKHFWWFINYPEVASSTDFQIKWPDGLSGFAWILVTCTWLSYESTFKKLNDKGWSIKYERLIDCMKDNSLDDAE